MEVDLSGRTFVFPSRCACCCESSDAQLTIAAMRSWGKRVIHQETKAWDVPYCTVCITHVGSTDNAYTISKVIRILTPVGVVIGWLSASFLIGLALGIGIVVAGGVLFYQQRSNAKAQCKPTCASPKRAIAYLGWQGALHRFDVQSAMFAQAFMNANRQKLVNISAEASTLLTPAHSNPDAPRGPRTYVS
jgi:hypothetical protein